MPVNQVKLHIHFVAGTLPNVEEYANEVKIQSFPWRSPFFHYVPLLYAVWNELDRKKSEGRKPLPISTFVQWQHVRKLLLIALWD